MKSPRYTILIANRSTGAVRRLSIARRTAIAVLVALAALPLLIGLGASTTDPAELAALRSANENLRVENESYRAATGELADQIASLQSALTKLSDQAQLDPAERAALDKLPAVIRSRATGGAAVPPAAAAVESPASTFGLLKNLLTALEGRLATVKDQVESQQALARATPSIWPLTGWLSSGFGVRKDPFNGSPDFHSGLDIAANRGTPVRATADGTVSSANYNGAYGNCIVIDHGFGIGTRFGHLSAFAVHAGQRVHRGEIVGYVGATGRTTGPHLHYEILLNGQPINPLRLLAKP
ncbi:MAG TPA: M23 family metallopeptidase [Vicinamibacterales bacterium]|jgi:murein DD-endopeptidase MepM/ murein hydrolase activator NlpD|nr:M23 family metallopeptidase [Vicinamibacterales bacterium]